MTAPKRRWFRFGLGGLFLTIAVVGCIAGYVRAYPRELFEWMVLAAITLPICWGIEGIAYGIDKLLGRR